ncbi:MAG: YraN family protein [Rikenellaceae bacterium]|nr:YraN family protein [Rikenellaceae bacterium]
MNTSAETGKYGESVVCEYLQDNGFDILHTNWRNGRYELDIVAQKDGYLHIVEVKTRKKDSLTSPESAMTRTKFRFLCKAAEFYIALYHIDTEVQFDLASVIYTAEGYEIDYIPDVMSSVW